MIQLALSMLAATSSIVCQAEKMEAPSDSLSAAQDSIYKSLTLQEVKVTVPSKTRMNGDAMLTRIVGTAVANAGSAVDALAKVPGMMTRNGELQVIGKGTPIYYVNGRKVTDLTELQRISSHEIKDVEVISTPGARYDAQTSAVVRIRTLRKQGDGFGITLDTRDAKALSCTNNQWNSNLRVNYHHRSLDVFGGFTYDQNYLGRYATRVTQNTFYKQRSDEAGNAVGNYLPFAYRQDGTTDLSQRYNSVNLQVGADWQIAEKHSVGMKVEHYENLKGVGDFLMTNDISKCDALGNMAKNDYRLIDRLLSNTHTDTDHSRSWLANAYYLGKWGKWEIDWNVDYYQTNEGVDTYTSEVSEIENREVNSLTSTENRLIATKLVLSRPLGRGKLNFGTELAFVNRKSDYSINATSISDSRNEVEENTYAAFVEYGKMIPRWGMWSLGVRYEHVDFSYEDALTSSANLSRRHDHLYPYLSWATRIGEVQGSVSYAVKTRRPNYRNLRSNIEYNNRFTLSTGNPTLANETRHEVGVNARWRFMALSLGYLYTKDGIYDWMYPYDEEGTVLVSWVNFDKPIHQLSAFVNLSPVVGIWQPNYTLGVQKQWLSFSLDDPRSATGKREVSYGKPMMICNLNNAFRLPTKNEDGKGAWQLELNSELMSACHFGNAEIKNWSWNLSCAIQKSFLSHDALTLRLVVSDIFHKTYNNVAIDLGNHILTQTHILGQERNCYDFQRLTLTARYSFNAMGKTRYKGKGAGKSFIERM